MWESICSLPVAPAEIDVPITIDAGKFFHERTSAKRKSEVGQLRSPTPLTVAVTSPGRNLVAVLLSLGIVAALLATPLQFSPTNMPQTLPAQPVTISPPAASLSLDPDPSDWPTYMEDPQRTSANPAETTVTVSNAKNLVLNWSYLTSGSISASTTLVDGIAYVGSWDGYEYAFTASTGDLVWKANLGLAVTSGCGTQGVGSSATVDDGTLYVGGGNGYFYALDTATGAVDWSYLVGDPSDGYYNWASPLLYDGFVYVGVSSFCDHPLVPGGLLQLDQTTGVLVNEFHTTPTGEIGSSVWGSPSVDPATNTVFFATGNTQTGETGEFADSIVAVNATTMNLVSSWEIPAAQQVPDGDFGSTPTVFHISGGETRVGALNKNGFFYAWDAEDLAAGPVWSDHLTTGQSIGSAAFAEGLVFVGTGTASFDGTNSSGAAWALDPDTGDVVWEAPLTGRSLAAPAYANGLLVVDGGTHVFVLDAKTGARLNDFGCSALFFAPPSIAHGRIFVGCSDGTEKAFDLPTEGSVPLSVSSLVASPNPVVAGSSTTITAIVNGGVEPYSYTYTGLPFGCVAVDLPTFSCSPTVSGEFLVRVTVDDANGSDASRATTLSVEPVYLVEFPENGLPPGTSWSVSLNGTLRSSSGTTIDFSLPNGSYPFTVTAVSGYAAFPSSGTESVSGTPVSRNISWTPTIQKYSVAFSEMGLPAGTFWSVVLGGTSNSTTTAIIGFAEPSGSYGFTVSTVPGYSLPSYSGTVDVSNRTAEVNLTWTTFRYSVTFAESGLGSGTSWSVTLNGSESSSTSARVEFSEPNGTYDFSISSVASHSVAPSSGAVSVQGADVREPITFTLIGYNVTFSESGLPANTPWAVRLNGVPEDSTGVQVLFQEPNGSYNFTVSTSSGYRPSPASGSLNVVGSDVMEPVRFSTPAMYSLSIVETGLPAASPWSVTVNGTLLTTNTIVASVRLPNGTYSVLVAPVAGYRANVGSIDATIAGHDIALSVSFAAALFTVAFTETGLPVGASWSVTLNGTVESSKTTTVVFTMGNGRFVFTIGEVGGHSSSPSSGTVVVAGTNVSLPVQFATASVTSSGLSPLDGDLIGAAVVEGIAGVVITWAILRRRREQRSGER